MQPFYAPRRNRNVELAEPLPNCRCVHSPLISCHALLTCASDTCNNLSSVLHGSQEDPGAKMSRRHRRTTSVVGVAFGALLASPLIAFCTGSVASADAGDDLVGIGPFAIGAYNDTVTYDSSTLA